MQRGMAPPQGLAAAGLRSNKKVSMPPRAIASAAEEPAGPPPITATRSFLPEMWWLDLMMRVVGFFWMDFGVLKVKWREWSGWDWAAIFGVLVRVLKVLIQCG